MGGYPAKVKSLTFLADGQLMATAGATGAVVWPFGGADGPMGKQAAEVGFDEGSAGHPRGREPAERAIWRRGCDDGRVWRAATCRRQRARCATTSRARRSAPWPYRRTAAASPGATKPAARAWRGRVPALAGLTAACCRLRLRSGRRALDGRDGSRGRAAR